MIDEACVREVLAEINANGRKAARHRQALAQLTTAHPSVGVVAKRYVEQTDERSIDATIALYRLAREFSGTPAKVTHERGGEHAQRRRDRSNYFEVTS